MPFCGRVALTKNDANIILLTSVTKYFTHLTDSSKIKNVGIAQHGREHSGRPHLSLLLTVFGLVLNSSMSHLCKIRILVPNS